jgi:hypothetical protein
MIRMLFRQMADAVQRFMVERTDINTAGRKAGRRLSLGDQRDIKAAFGKQSARGETRHARADNDYIVLCYAHYFLSIARMPI